MYRFTPGVFLYILIGKTGMGTPSALLAEMYKNTPGVNLYILVGAVGLEPTYPKMADFKSAASANSATLPRAEIIIAQCVEQPGQALH